jgi:hypothetical protein
MQDQLHNSGPLLSLSGEIIHSGWAKRLLLEYEREKIHAHSFRIKEWDCYEICNPDFGIVLLIYDIGYFAKAIVKWVDYNTHFSEEVSETILFSKGSLKLPPSADSGDITFSKGNSHWNFYWEGHNRMFEFNFPKFQKGKGISGKLSLYQDPDMDTMVNVIPFKKKTQFVYVQKINCMPVIGKVSIGAEEYLFSSKNESYACLDWSRAVFPYHAPWKWASASGKVNDQNFGFNIDYGFGSNSSKNMIFYQNKGHHLDEVYYQWDPKNLMKPWTFSSPDGRVEMTLTPKHIEKGNINLLIFKSISTKAYGFFTGKVVLDNGKVMEIQESDRLFGGAEFVENKW